MEVQQSPYTPDMTGWQEATPTNGSTVVSDGSPSLILLNTSLLLALTIQFPAAPRNGQTFRIVPRAAVTTLSLTSPDGKAIVGSVASISLSGVSLRWVYNKTADSWLKM